MRLCVCTAKIELKLVVIVQMIGQNIAINGMQAQIQELRIEAMSMNTSSGIITKKTKFVFRSRSSRIIWLLQMSAEMWDFDRVNALVIFIHL